ncbi:uncharacterized protein CTHT_0025700 [Thermochaetoides thermophila DSM 1495]|uniref:Store-operated calcium entry-associated regulatory factor n=1 Tax=Chaetomium thermophilum (strain DSM 1495 / CBS 144.50 / IMI 039719) TaxID=759272 RepID=G0S618_CHATD|nr:hypothetical protein CTHT_0025700 [Thermochaetoides thermophila DSM 1495]EGS20734.1 hypothetical protein CTHT_0025700 [Thermochaetoides thermophila DSM 1495]
MRLTKIPSPPTSLPTLFLALLTALSFPSRAFAVRGRPKDAILLSEVQSLTLYANRLTTARRTKPIPQLKCVSPQSLCDIVVPHLKTMRCVNQGHSYTSEDIEWACTATLPTTVRLDRTEVICEGYESPDDPYVLRGSCGVEYTVQLTAEGERRYPGLVGIGRGNGDDWAGWLFAVVFVAVLVWIVYGACTQTGRNAGGTGGFNTNRRGGWGPGGGGGGNDAPWDDPPPPYPGTKPSSSTEQQGWRPGFWSGAAAGAAAGYMAGRNSRNREREYGYGTRWGEGSGWTSGSGWGGGRSSSSSSAGSTSRHETTGYGSTSRR